MKIQKTAQWWARSISLSGIVITMVLVYFGIAKSQEIIPDCERIIKADVVAFDQPFFYNRLGAVNPAGMIYSLRRDVRAKTTAGLVPGNVQLKDYKRARPITLRMNVGDCFQITFQNLLDPARADDNQPATRTASVHVVGLNLQKQHP